MKTELSGILLVDKPVGWTSHDVVAYIRRVAGQKSVGHTGTLDPLASGLMIILLGEATKLSSYFSEKNKKYLVEVLFGLETDSLDITGKLRTCILNQTSEKDDCNLNQIQFLQSIESKLPEILQNKTGEKEYEIPLFSAKKIDGVRLYEHAHAVHLAPELPKKLMNFYIIKQVDAFTNSVLDLEQWISSLELRMQKFTNDQRLKSEFANLKTNISALVTLPKLSFEVECSKGSFIRSWAQSLGEDVKKLFKVKDGAVVSALRRIETQNFHVNQALLLSNMNLEVIEKSLVPVSQALHDVKKLLVSGQDLNLLRNGQIGHSLRGQLIQVFEPEVDECIQIHERTRPGLTTLLALIGFEKDRGFYIKRVFNLAKN